MAGAVGRPAIPSKVHYLGGNPSKKSTGDLLDEFQPDVELAKCPSHLKAEARREYARLGEELERYGLISTIDRDTLAMIATQWARYVWAENQIHKLNEADARGEAGLVDRSPNGYKVQSVYLQISNKAIEVYTKLAAEFGLTPAARSRVKAGTPQMHLPGMGDEPGRPAGPPSLRSFA
jgi:P27 family predicted phage terminase small subunit